jgi:Tfp pilus assembly protein PilF
MRFRSFRVSNFLVCSIFALILIRAIPLPAQSITYSDHIQSIVENNCVECHSPNGIGPFSLQTYDQVESHSRQIVEVVESRYMPPWKPRSGYGPALLGEKVLTEKQIDLLVGWHESGRVRGDSTEMVSANSNSNAWSLGQPDLILEVPGDYQLPAEGQDIYHNFVLSIPLTDRKYVRAVEFQPRTKLVIHHAVMVLDTTNWSRDRSGAEAGPGFSGMDLGNARDPSGQFVGWTPGQVPFQAFPGTAWELNPGTDMVLQLHMLPSGKPVDINPRIGLYFSKDPPTLKTMTLKLRSVEIDIAAGDANYLIEESIQLPVGVRVLGLYPHAHYIAKDMKIYAELPNGKRQGLLHIPDWDFNWQSDYRYVEPLDLPAGSRLVMDYKYDNSAANPRNPSQPPQRVELGWNSSDEMGEVMINVLLNDAVDYQTLFDAQANYKINSVGKAPFFYQQGIQWMNVGNIPEAIAAFQVSLDADPEYVVSANKLGVLYEKQGLFEESRVMYEKATAIDPNKAAYLMNLARLLDQHISKFDAYRLLENFLKENPHNEEVRLQLAGLYFQNNRNYSGIETLNKGLERNPSSAAINMRLGWIYNELKDSTNSRKFFNAAACSNGDTEELKSIQADAMCALALQSKTEGDNKRFHSLLENALSRDTNHRGAHLLLAGEALSNKENARAASHLSALIHLPKDPLFTTEEYVGNLPFPDGATLIVDLLCQDEKWDEARKVILFSLDRAKVERKAQWISNFDKMLGELPK